MKRRELLTAVGAGTSVLGVTYLVGTEFVEGQRTFVENCDQEHGEGEWVLVPATEEERRESVGRFYIGTVDVCVPKDDPRAERHGGKA